MSKIRSEDLVFKSDNKAYYEIVAPGDVILCSKSRFKANGSASAGTSFDTQFASFKSEISKYVDFVERYFNDDFYAGIAVTHVKVPLWSVGRR